MIRVNLLPSEILEKRKHERIWVYVVFAALGVFVALAMFWFVLFLQVTARQSDVDGKKQEAAALEQQAAAFKVFEERQASLAGRQAVVDRALTGRRVWSSIFTDLSLVLPGDVWVTKITAEEPNVTIDAVAQDRVSEPDTSGYKTVAKMLTRLSDLDEFRNVWLIRSSKAGFQKQPVINFQIAADVATPTPAPSADTVTPASTPAPPGTP